MSGRGKMVKRICEPDAMTVKAQLPQLRTKINVGQQTETHEKAREYVKNIEFKYGTQPGEDDERPSSIGKPYKILCSKDKIPSGLSMIVDFFQSDRRIPANEVSKVVITIYPPPKDPSSYENIIEAAQMITRDRFIYFINSDEFLHYRMIDATKLQAMLGMAVPSNAAQSIPEHVERGNGYHMSQTSAVALSLRFNNERSFQTNIRNGKGTVLKTYDKLPTLRYIIVIDFIMTNSVFRETMKKTANIVGDIADQKPNTVQGKMAQAAVQKMKEEAKEDLPVPPPLVQNEDDKTAAPSSSSVRSQNPKSMLDKLREDSGAVLIEIPDSKSTEAASDKVEILEDETKKKDLLKEVGDLL